MYGARHVVAFDGNSPFVAAARTLPVKNNIAIYDQIYR